MLLLLVAWLMAQERATVIAPKAIDATIRSYEVIGVSWQTPPTIYTPPAAGPTLAMPRGVSTTSIMITYVDNVGTQYADVHTDTSGADQLIRALLDGTGGSVRARLLQHLIDEHKIPPAKIEKGKT